MLLLWITKKDPVDLKIQINVLPFKVKIVPLGIFTI